MAEEANEDSWLYGSNEEQAARREEEELLVLNIGNDSLNYSDEAKIDADQTDPSEMIDTLHADFEDADESRFEEPDGLDGTINASSKNGDDDSDSDTDDDDINVVIGDIKSGANYVKQRTGLPATSAQPQDKPKSAGGKFNIEEFESVGTINGTIAHEFNVESIEDKPWRKPGSDITDYFNYGFNEDTWRAYCERQKKMRVQESGVGLAGLTIVSAHSNSSGGYNKMMDGGIKIGINHRAGPPPFRKPGSIDVIGGAGGQMMNRRDNEMMMPQHLKPPPPKENVIQVMTADRREYSRTVVGNKFDMPPPMNMPPPSFNINPEDFYDHEAEALNYGGGYEPTQDSQWNNNAPPAWSPGDIKQLTPGGFPQPVPPVGISGGPMGPIPMRMPMMSGPMGIPQGMPPNKMMIPPLANNDESRKSQDADRRRYEERRDRERRERDRPADSVAGFERRRSRSRDRTTDRSRDSKRRKERSRSRDRKRRSKSREKKDDRASSSRRETSTKSSSKKSHKKDKEDSD